MKKILVLMFAALVGITLTGCGNSEIPIGALGELDILMWNGDGKTYKDIGSMDLTKDDLTAKTVAEVYAVAKAYNAAGNNVKINLTTKAYGPNDMDPNTGEPASWEQELDKFLSVNRKYPDIWLTDNITRDLSNGLLLDLSLFEDDAVYKTYNPSLLKMTEFYGFQAGLPNYALPHGVFVNKELAEKNNITVPGVNWTWDEYDSFVNQASPMNKVYGTWNNSMSIIRSNIVEKQLQERDDTSNIYVDITTSEFRNSVEDLANHAKSSVKDLIDSGDISDDYINEMGGEYPLNFFSKEALLTLNDYYATSEIGNVTVKGMQTYIEANDWDIYPAPNMTNDKTNENNVNILYDPIVMYNYAGRDGVLSEAEEAKAWEAYNFMSYYSASTEAWEARAEQEFTGGVSITTGTKVYLPALSDSLPLIQGDEYSKQMEIWYSTSNHAPYKDKAGWQEIIRLWEKGNIVGVSDKAYPISYVTSANQTENCLYYIDEFKEVQGVTILESSWYSNYSAGFATANTNMNKHFDNSYSAIRTALNKYYGRNL